MSSTGRICCCYFITSVIISFLIYILILSYMNSLSKIEDLQGDVKEIFKALTQLNRNSLGASNNKNPVESTACNDRDIEDLVLKYMKPLRNELDETKRIVDQLRCQSGIRKQSQTDIMRTDYALESLGGRIEYVKADPYGECSFFLSIFGLGALSNEPRNILNPSMQPGNCYAFKGSRSIIVVKLMAKVFVDSVGIEHIPESVSPDGTVMSAPKDFSVFGLSSREDDNPFYFGTFAYNAYLRQPAQVFNFNKLSTESYNYLKFEFTSNNGHPNHTCIYRISVHGKLDKSIKKAQACSIS